MKDCLMKNTEFNERLLFSIDYPESVKMLS